MTTDSPEQTPVSELARKAIRLMAQGGAMRIMDIPGDSSLSSHTFGGDVSRAVADLCRPDRSPAGEVRMKARKLLDELAYECLQTGDMLSDSVQKAYGDLEDELLKPAALSPAPAPSEDMEPLGADFEAVWDANADELYESKPAPAPELHHYSGCAVHNAPAYEPGPCDCGGYIPAPEREGLMDDLKDFLGDMKVMDMAGADLLLDRVCAALAAYEESRR